MSYLLMLIGGILLIAICGALISAALKALGRLLLSGSLGLVLGVGFGTFLFRQEPDQAELSILLGLALTVPSYVLISLFSSVRRNGVTAKPTAVPAPRHVSSSPRPADAKRRSIWSKPTDTRSLAWDRLSEAAAGYEARVIVARRACERGYERLKPMGLDMGALELRTLLKKHVPRYISERVDTIALQAGSAREAMLDDLVSLLERVAAHCGKRGLETADQAAAAIGC